jgi:hypothetical protein
MKDTRTRREGKSLVGSKSTSEEDSEDEQKLVVVASLDLAEPGSLFTYEYTKDYSDIPKKSDTCLMARGAMEDDLVLSSIPKNSDIFLMEEVLR